MKVKEVAELVGVSVRTLHHYDEIGLLIPAEISESGYRLYTEENLATLQQILFFKELDFSLQEIKKIINNPSYDRLEALKLQRKMLIEKRKNLTKMITTIDKTIKHMTGGIQMTNTEKFAGLNFRENPYEQEARKRWGNEAVDQSNKRLEKLSDEEQIQLTEKWDDIFTELAKLRDQSPDSNDVQKAIKKWFGFLNKHFATYSLDAFFGLSQLYVSDIRFTENIDKYGEGLAIFMSKAMKVFVENNKK